MRVFRIRYRISLPTIDQRKFKVLVLIAARILANALEQAESIVRLLKKSIKQDTLIISTISKTSFERLWKKKLI